MITGLIEVILYVEDMNAQVAFYRDTLGLPVGYPTGLADYGGEFWVLLNAGACIDPQKSFVPSLLFEMWYETFLGKYKLALHGGGSKRLGADTPKLVFGVSDIEQARQTLQARNVVLSEVRSPAPGISVCDAEDPEGNPFSIEAHGRPS